MNCFVRYNKTLIGLIFAQCEVVFCQTIHYVWPFSVYNIWSSSTFFSFPAFRASAQLPTQRKLEACRTAWEQQLTCILASCSLLFTSQVTSATTTRFFAMLHNHNVEPMLNPVRVRNNANKETEARQLFHVAKDHNNQSIQDMSCCGNDVRRGVGHTCTLVYLHKSYQWSAKLNVLWSCVSTACTVVIFMHNRMHPS